MIIDIITNLMQNARKFIELLHVLVIIMRIKNTILLLGALISPALLANTDNNWLRDDSRSNSNVIQYLEENNAQTAQYMQPLQKTTEALLTQWQSMSPQKANKPWLIQGNTQFRIETIDGERVLLQTDKNNSSKRVLLNLTQRGQAHDYYSLANWAMDASHSYLAIAEDLRGSGQYQVQVINLKSGLETTVANNVESSLIWSTDSSALYVIGQEEKTLRSNAVLKIDIANKNTITTVYEEPNSAWLVSAYQASDRQYALVQTNSEIASEQRYLNLATGELSEPIISRQDGLEYYSDIADNQLFMMNNQTGEFVLYRSQLSTIQENPNTAKLTPIYTPKSDQTLADFYLFKSGIALKVEQAQSSYLTVLAKGEQQTTTAPQIPLTGQGKAAWISRNGDYASNVVRIRSMSMTTPPTWQEFNVKSHQLSTLSQDQYPDFNSEDYHSTQVQVDNNGVSVPVTLAYKKEAIKSNSPVILYGYGAYGVTMRPYFMPQIVSLLDQGAIYAIAHVRGGGYLGENWHTAGKGIQKQNGISDFIAAARVMARFQHKKRPLYAIGGSAGGTLVAAALNQQPELFSGAVLQVPFVDVVNSMSDSSLPLTAQQYGEWGNPNTPSELTAMNSYDPYQNIGAKQYPPLLVRVGLHDSRVPFWEGAKYIAKLRQKSTDHGPYLLQTDFESGHFSDRRKALNKQAQEYAFLLNLLNNKSQITE